MGAASTFIKEGMCHISVVQRMAPWGVVNDTEIHLFFLCLFVQCGFLRHVDICELSWCLCVSLRRARCFAAFMLCLILTLVHFLVISWSQCFCLINIQHSPANKVEESVPIFARVSWESSRSFFLLLLIFLCLYRFSFVFFCAYRLLYYSWSPYCFWRMQNACFPSYITFSTPYILFSLRFIRSWSPAFLQVTALIIYLHALILAISGPYGESDKSCELSLISASFHVLTAVLMCGCLPACAAGYVLLSKGFPSSCQCWGSFYFSKMHAPNREIYLCSTLSAHLTKSLSIFFVMLLNLMWLTVLIHFLCLLRISFLLMGWWMSACLWKLSVLFYFPSAVFSQLSFCQPRLRLPGSCHHPPWSHRILCQEIYLIKCDDVQMSWL